MVRMTKTKASDSAFEIRLFISVLNFVGSKAGGGNLEIMSTYCLLNLGSIHPCVVLGGRISVP